MTLKEINKALESKEISPALRMELEKRKEILLNNKEINKHGNI